MTSLRPGAGHTGADDRLHTPEDSSGLEYRVADPRILEAAPARTPAARAEQDLPDAGRLTEPLGPLADPPDAGGPRAMEVFYPDDRKPVGDPGAYPWRALCWLHITARDGVRSLGTGWLAGPRLVVTAGHCVYRHRHGGWARSIEVVPGRDGDRRPFGTFTSSAFKSVSGWTRDRNPELDYGGILLRGDEAPGERTGWLGFGPLSDDELLATPLDLAGYPDDKAAGTLWWHARRIERVSPRSLLYTLDTEGGQSGSPLWRRSNGTRCAVAIHAGGLGGLNQAVRISGRVSKNLSDWNRAASRSP